MPIVNWTFPVDPKILRRIEQVLQVEFGGEIPYDSPTVLQALNTGRPLVMGGPKPGASEAIYKVAYRLSRKKMEPVSGGNPSPILTQVRDLGREK